LTLIVILLNVAVFAFELTLPRYGMTLGGFYAKAGATPYELANGLDVPPGDLVPWWATLFTSMFIHGGWLNLIVNMLYLLIFGKERRRRSRAGAVPRPLPRLWPRGHRHHRRRTRRLHRAVLDPARHLVRVTGRGGRGFLPPS